LQLTKVLLYDKVVRKILAILFSIAFLLIFVSFFSQRSFATAVGSDCNNIFNWTNTCSDDGQHVLSCNGPKWIITKDCPIHTSTCSSSTHDCVAACDSTCQSQHCFTAIQYCTSSGGTYISTNNHFCASGQYYCDPATAPPTGSTTNTDTGTVASGSYGCAYKLDDAHTPVSGFSCKDGATCSFVPGTSTVDTPGGKVDYGYCLPSPTTNCIFCGSGSELLQQGKSAGQCHNLSTDQYSAPQSKDCTKDQICSPVYGCEPPGSKNPPLSICGNSDNGSCDTAIGLIPTDLPGLLTRVFSIALAIAGIAALGLIIASGYRLMISQGNPEQVKGAREQLTAAIIGLLFIIFSLVLLQIIGVNILSIPGFGA
jgi:hypothetical protein